MTTTTKNLDVRAALNTGDPGLIGTAAKKLKLGNMLSIVQVTFAALASAAAQDITTAAAAAAATLDGLTLDDGETLPPIGQVVALRVTAGTLAAGPALVTDAGGTPTAIGALAAHVVTLSADGTTLTFQAAVTGFVLWYIPRPYVDLDASLPQTAP